MRLLELADLIYQNANEISFGNIETWDTETFLSPWFKRAQMEQPNAPGLYWFISDSQLNNLVRPSDLPEKGCDFSLTSSILLNHFTEDLFPIRDDNKRWVVYNGHEKNVGARIRSHFSVDNNRTGALGLKYYSLSQNIWSVRYFTTRDLHRVEENKRQILANLLNLRTGRIALETAWRIKHGWPPLCKA